MQVCVSMSCCKYLSPTVSTLAVLRWVPSALTLVKLTCADSSFPCQPALSLSAEASDSPAKSSHRGLRRTFLHHSYLKTGQGVLRPAEKGRRARRHVARRRSAISLWAILPGGRREGCYSSEHILCISATSSMPCVRVLLCTGAGAASGRVAPASTPLILSSGNRLLLHINSLMYIQLDRRCYSK